MTKLHNLLCVQALNSSADTYKQHHYTWHLSMQQAYSLELQWSQQTVHPTTYYEQLAQAGALYDFLQTTMRDRFHSDAPFRFQMLRMLVEYSPIVLPEIECELLRELSNALSEFLSTVEQCHKKHQSL